MDIASALPYVIIFVLMGAFVYFMGDLADTLPNYKKRFNEDYLAVLNTTDPDTMKGVLNRMGSDPAYARWIDENEEMLKRTYNRDIMNQRMNEVIGST